MKSDINLIPSTSPNRIYIILLIILGSILIVGSTILIPIQRKNHLLAEYERITQELMGSEKLNNQYLSLEAYSTGLLKRVEILNEASARQGGISRLFDVINESLSPYIELTNIHISGNILAIKGIAPNDQIIADSIIKLQRDEIISSVKIQEISLDKESHKRIFDLKCITLFNESNIDDKLDEVQDSDQLDLGGDDR